MGDTIPQNIENIEIKTKKSKKTLYDIHPMINYF